MKVFVVVAVVCFAAFALAEEDYIEAAKKLEQCYADLGITEENAMELSEDPVVKKCSIACLLKGLQIMHDDGTLNLERIRSTSKLSQEELNAYDSKCKQAAAGITDNKMYGCEVAGCLESNDFFKHFSH